MLVPVKAVKRVREFFINGEAANEAGTLLPYYSISLQQAKDIAEAVQEELLAEQKRLADLRAQKESLEPLHYFGTHGGELYFGKLNPETGGLILESGTEVHCFKLFMFKADAMESLLTVKY